MRDEEKYKESQRKWREAHPDYFKEYTRKWKEEHGYELRLQTQRHHDRVKREVATHYGNGRCACVKCGYAILEALTIDHIYNDGAEHRKSLGTNGGSGFYAILKREKFPEGYQTLCWNCNRVKYSEYLRSHPSAEKPRKQIKIK